MHMIMFIVTICIYVHYKCIAFAIYSIIIIATCILNTYCTLQYNVYCKHVPMYCKHVSMYCNNVPIVHKTQLLTSHAYCVMQKLFFLTPSVQNVRKRLLNFKHAKIYPVCTHAVQLCTKHHLMYTVQGLGNILMYITLFV